MVWCEAELLPPLDSRAPGPLAMFGLGGPASQSFGQRGSPSPTPQLRTRKEDEEEEERQVNQQCIAFAYIFK